MKIASEGETLGIYVEDEGEGEIHRERTYPMEGKRIPQESSRIARGEPWSPENRLQVAGVGWGWKNSDLDEGVREPLYIPWNSTRRIYPMGDQICPT
jgi:hypothetical protein